MHANKNQIKPNQNKELLCARGDNVCCNDRVLKLRRGIEREISFRRK